MTNGLSHPYHVDESNFILGVAGVTFHFYFAFYYIHSHPYHLDEFNFILGVAGVTFHFYFAFYYIYIGSGTTRFITVETRMFPDYAGIAPTPSRWRHGTLRTVLRPENVTSFYV